MIIQLQDSYVFVLELDLFKTHCALNDLDQECAHRMLAGTVSRNFEFISTEQ